MDADTERDIVERLREDFPEQFKDEQPAQVIFEYERERHEAAYEITRLRDSQAKVVEAIKSYRSCWDVGSHRVDLYRQKIATEMLSCVEAALAEHGGQPSPREVALEKALRELAIDSYYAGSELRHYCRICLEEWRIGTGEEHTPECLLAASPEPAMLSARKEDGHEPE